MVNSRWTLGHIDQLWRARHNRARVVYPPCDNITLQQLPLARAPLPAAAAAPTGATAAVAATPVLVSVAQFRPEKNHALQLRAFALARQAAMKGELGGVAVIAATARRVASARLVFVGGVRNDADRARLERLKELAQELVRGVAALGPREVAPPSPTYNNVRMAVLFAHTAQTTSRLPSPPSHCFVLRGGLVGACGRRACRTRWSSGWGWSMGN